MQKRQCSELAYLQSLTESCVQHIEKTILRQKNQIPYYIQYVNRIRSFAGSSVMVKGKKVATASWICLIFKFFRGITNYCPLACVNVRLSVFISLIWQPLCRSLTYPMPGGSSTRRTLWQIFPQIIAILDNNCENSPLGANGRRYFPNCTSEETFARGVATYARVGEP
jgi:hypothetical protein